jgi:PPM family protein phosphatase
LRLADSAGRTDPGRKRRRNEDAFVLEPPLFAVADGMGGAQAGEVASRLAAAAFREFHEADELAPDERLRALVQEANRRIYDRARTDTGATGMGTTLTAALLEDGQVTIGHVGDSRAYRLREGQLEQLTEDHSLVADLMRSGRLTPEEAETHPQRSVITRALGPEPDVQVDVQSYQARGGDLFMVCSDGLTSMVPEARVTEILEGAGSLDRAGRELIGAANDAGGRDNITVILFRLEEVEGGEEPVAGEQETWEGEVPQAGAHTSTVAVAKPRAKLIEEPPPRTAPEPAAAKRRRRIPMGAIAVLVVLLIVAGGLWTASRAVYVLGVDDAGAVTLYQGLPYDLPFGIELYDRYYTSGVTLSQVPERLRERYTDHQLRSKEDAENLVSELERGRIQ